MNITFITATLILAVCSSATFADVAKDNRNSQNTNGHHDSAEIEMLKQQVEAVAKTRRIEQANLATFDDLDFNVFSGQKWDKLSKSHGKDVIVHWPDGHVTKGIETHINDLKAMFLFAPDTRIQEHPIRIASGEWTAVAGTMEGTFSKPMATPNGDSIAPTGKGYKIGMITIGHWTKEGVMDEEWLQWDNQSFMNQIGLGK